MDVKMRKNSPGARENGVVTSSVGRVRSTVMSMFVCVFVYLSVFLSVCLSVCPLA